VHNSPLFSGEQKLLVMQEHESSTTVVQIQALRGLAAIAVASVHLNQVGLMLAGRNEDPIMLYALASGVDLFFVISGFIMVYSSRYLFGAPRAQAVFIERRLARIVPLYWATTPLAIVVMSLPVSWPALLGSYFFIPYRDSMSRIVPINGVGWTLNFEMFFYALFALAIVLPRGAAVPAVCATLAAAVAAGLAFQPQYAPLQFWSDPIILEFGFGMLIAIAFLRKWRMPGMLCIVLFVAAGTAVFFSAPRMVPSGQRVVVWGIPAAIMVAAAALGPQSRKNWATDIAVALGNSSYSIYLLHPLVGALLFLEFHHIGYRPPTAIILAIGITLTVLISIFVFKFFEHPTTRALHKLLEGNPPVLPARPTSRVG
jgi:exopolysaccharide production protein ExoZ